MLCTSSRFKSTGLFLTVSDSAVSEILFSFPSTIFPSFVFTESLAPDTAVLNCDQSFTLAGFKSWALSVSDGDKIQAKRVRLMASLFFRGCISFSPFQDCFLASRSALWLRRCASCITVTGHDQARMAAFISHD